MHPRRRKLTVALGLAWTMVYCCGKHLAACAAYRPPAALYRSSSSSFGGAMSWSRRKRRRFHRSSITMMPEGPEVRHLVDQLQQGVGKRLVDLQFLSGRYVRNDTPTGFTSFAKTMTPLPTASRDHAPTGTKNHLPTVDVITKWQAKGKFIFLELDGGSANTREDEEATDDYGRSIWITLGMSGRFVNEQIHQQDSRYARWYLALMDLETSKSYKIYYHDQRNFGTLRFSLSKAELAAKLSSLGPDILDASTTDTVLHTIWNDQDSSLNVCKFLMNQSKICGIGNYLLAEGLYRANVDPFASLEEIDRDRQKRLFHELRSSAAESYHAQRNPETSNFALQCYGQTRCPRGREIIQDTAGPHGRTIWYTKEQLFQPLEKRFVLLQRPGDDRTTDSRTANDNDLTTITRKSWREVDLSRHLKDEGWRQALEPALESTSFVGLQDFLKHQIENDALVFPMQHQVFAALNLCPLSSVKVVIVGQDPYHGLGQGHGLAFSVPTGVAIPPSLRNIFQELEDDLGVLPPGRSGNLESWAKQGVLLLNTVLTVESGKANSHANKGWEQFTDAVIDCLNRERTNLVFLLWGNPAQKKGKDIDESKHTVIRTSHPSPLGARKTASPFLGSKCFSRANEALSRAFPAGIDWKQLSSVECMGVAE